MPDKSHKRRRRTIVCTNCRRRKIACDRSTPCDQCVQACLECTYYNGHVHTNSNSPVDRHNSNSASSKHRSSSSASSVQTVLHGCASESTLANVDYRSSVFDLKVAPALPGTVSIDMNAPEWFDADVMNTLHPSLSTPTDPSVAAFSFPDQVTSLLDPSPETGHPPLAPPPLYSEPFSAEPSNVLFSKSRMYGPTHWMTILCKLKYHQHGLFDDVIGVLFRGPGQPIIQKCKRLARRVKSTAADPRSLSRPLHDFMPPREICDELVRLYLRTFEAVVRVLHVSSLQRDYLQYWSNPQAASEALILQLLLIMAIGTCFYHDVGATEGTLHFQAAHWIRACHMRLVAPFRKKDLNLRGVQSQCLLVIALLTNTNAVGGDLVWTSTASLVQNARTIGLHIAPSQLHVTPLDAEIRRRLWATILELAVQSSLDSGNNPIISADALNCEYPSNLNDSQISDSTKTLPTGHPSTTFTQSSIQCALLRSLPVRLRIAEVLGQGQGELSYDTALNLGAELTAACRETSKMIDTFFSSASTADDSHARPSAFQIKVQDLLTRRFLLLLHAQFAHKATTDVAYHFSRTVCQECSLLLLSPSSSSSWSSSSSPSTRSGKSGTALWSSPSSPGGDDNYYADLQLFGDGLLKNIFLIASLAVCGELLQQLREDSSPAAFSLPRRELLQALDHGVRLTRRRVRAGETNAKAAAFFACMRAHIGASRCAAQPRHAVTDAARTTLGECCTVLEARLHSLATNSATTSGRGGNSRPPMHFPSSALGRTPDTPMGHSSPAASGAAERRLSDSSLSFDSSDTWNASSWDENSGFSY